jgi:hypothetical protein
MPIQALRRTLQNVAPHWPRTVQRVAPIKKPRRSGAFGFRGDTLGTLDVGSLLAFRALRDFELDFLTFFEGLKAVHVDCGEMREQIFAAIIWSDEAKAFGIIEPLNGTCCHKITFD